jgi:hypothetical protein
MPDRARLKGGILGLEEVADVVRGKDALVGSGVDGANGSGLAFGEHKGGLALISDEFASAQEDRGEAVEEDGPDGLPGLGQRGQVVAEEVRFGGVRHYAPDVGQVTINAQARRAAPAMADK